MDIFDHVSLQHATPLHLHDHGFTRADSTISCGPHKLLSFLVCYFCSWFKGLGRVDGLAEMQVAHWNATNLFA